MWRYQNRDRCEGERSPFYDYGSVVVEDTLYSSYNRFLLDTVRVFSKFDGCDIEWIEECDVLNFGFMYDYAIELLAQENQDIEEENKEKMRVLAELNNEKENRHEHSR